jgi:AraC-like DNA-binding protein
MNRHDPIFIRYILNFLVFALFILLLSVPIYRYVLNFTLKNELAFIEDRLNTGVAVINSTIEALNNVVGFTGRDSRFRVFKYETGNSDINPHLLTELQNTFGGLLMTHSIITDGGIIFSRDVILTRQRIFYATNLYTFYDQFLECGEVSYNEWRELLSAQRPFIEAKWYTSSDYGRYEAITFSTHWSDAHFPGGNILFYATLPINRLLALISEEEIRIRGFIRISDIQGNLLYETGSNSDGKFHVVSNQDMTGLLRFEIGVPASLVNDKMNPVKNLIFLFAAITGFVSLSLSLLFAYKSSQPLREFLKSIDITKNIRFEYEHLNRGGSRKLLKSLKTIFLDLSNSLKIVDTRLETSLQIIERQAQLLRAQIFEKALQRGVYDPADQADFQAVFPDFPKQFQLGVIRYDSPKIRTLHETVTSHLQLMDKIREQMDIYIQSIEGKAIIMLLPLSDPGDRWYARFQDLRSKLNQQSEEVLSFALSEVFERPQDLPRAWQQLQLINALPGVEHMRSVEQVENNQDDNFRFPLNISMLQMIYTSLCNANDETAGTILRECAVSLPEPEDYLISELTYSMLSNMILLFKLENPFLLTITAPEYVPGNQSYLFKEQFPECFSQICKIIRTRKEKSITQFGRQVLNYVSEHLYDPNLYINMISDHFNISAPTLQKLIKTISGQTFLVYVEKQRLSKAREMLNLGRYSIQEIASSCGFSNTNSFYKAFKRAYGFSPSKVMNKKTVINNFSNN